MSESDERIQEPSLEETVVPNPEEELPMFCERSSF